MNEFYHAVQSPTTKPCSMCHVEKPLSAFNKDRTSKDGYKHACRDCRAYRKKHPLIVQKPLFIVSRACTKCGVEKPLEQFSRAAKEKTGRRAICKVCQAAYGKQYFANKPGLHYGGLNHPPLPPAVNGGKVCRKCLIEKPLDQYHNYRRERDGKADQCKKCRREKALLNRGRNIARSRAHWEKSGEKYRAQHREWKKNNPLKITEINRRRDARKREVTADEVDYIHILERDGEWCYLCEKDILEGDEVNFDHIIPLARHGAHSELNIKLTHKKCNLRKGDRLLADLDPYLRRGIR